MKVTIYAINRTGTSEEYIGSSINFKSRWKKHLFDLRKGKHHCPALQTAWAQYGERAFSFVILDERECASVGERAALELQWIKSRGTYNTMTNFIIPTNLEPMSDAHKKLKALEIEAAIASNPEYRAFLKARGESLTAFIQSPEGRANMAEHTKRRWQDPEERKRLRAGLDRKDPEVEKRRAENIGKAHSTPEKKAMHRANTKALWETEEYRSKVTQKAAQNRWGDPEAKARQAEKMRAYHAKRRLETS